MVLLAYILICLVATLVFLVKKKYFFSVFFCLILFQPVFQKVLDPTIYGDTLRVVTFGRIQTNLMFSVCLFLIFPFFKLKIDGTVRRYSIYFLLFLFFHVLSVSFSEDINQSFNLFLIAVVQPILFFYLLMSIDKSYYENIFLINRSIASVVLCCFVLGVFYMIYEFGLSPIIVFENRYSNGVWINNSSLQTLSLVFPVLLFGEYNRSKMLKYMMFAVVLILEVLTMSRTLFAILLLQILLMVHYKLIKASRIVMAFFIFGFLIVTFLSSLDIDFFELITSRFTSSGKSAVDSALSDPRFGIYDVSIGLVQEHLWTGIGLGNFYKYTQHGYSDSHNMYLSVFVSRGIFVLLMILYAIYYFFKRNIYNVANTTGATRRLLLCLRIGMIGYLLASMTGADLFTYAGLCNARVMYFLIFIYVIQEKLGTPQNTIKGYGITKSYL